MLHGFYTKWPGNNEINILFEVLKATLRSSLSTHPTPRWASVWGCICSRSSWTSAPSCRGSLAPWSERQSPGSAAGTCSASAPRREASPRSATCDWSVSKILDSDWSATSRTLSRRPWLRSCHLSIRQWLYISLDHSPQSPGSPGFPGSSGRL